MYRRISHILVTIAALTMLVLSAGAPHTPGGSPSRGGAGGHHGGGHHGK